MENLPTEVVEKIFSFLDISLLASFSHVCSRWREIVTNRHFQPYLCHQDFSVRKKLLECGWNPLCTDSFLIRTLFWKVFKRLKVSWRQNNPTVTTQLVGVFGPENASNQRVTDMAVFRDKLYLAMEGCVVKVHDLDDFEFLHSLEEGEEPHEGGGEHVTRTCQLVLDNNTLAVSSSSRDKVKLYNCQTDELVGEIETRLGPIYNLAMNNRLLICLSGWSCLAWRIDSSRPESVRGQFQGIIPDFQPSNQFQNWLESHVAVINSNWLVTRATRIRTNVTDGNNRSVSFLHVRRIGPDGHLSEPLPQYSTSMQENVVEMNSMTISDDKFLAILAMIKEDSVSGSGRSNLKYVIQVIDLGSSEVVASLPTDSILASVQMPVCWKNDKLIIKIVPKPVGGFYSTDEEEDESGFQISLASWDVDHNKMVSIPAAKVGSSTDLIVVEDARLVVVSTTFTLTPLSHLEYDSDLETLAHMEADFNPENGPQFTVKAEMYNYWNTVEL